MSILTYSNDLNSDHIYETFWLDFKTAAKNAEGRVPALLVATSDELNAIRQQAMEREKAAASADATAAVAPASNSMRDWIDRIRLLIDRRVLAYFSQNLLTLQGYHLQILLDHLQRWLKICLARGELCDITLQVFYEIMKSRASLEPDLMEKIYQILQNDRQSALTQQSGLVMLMMEASQSARVDRLLKNPATRPVTVNTIIVNYSAFNPCPRMKSCAKLLAAINETKLVK